MTSRIFPIVEGHGDNEAVRVLIKRVLNEELQKYDFKIERPQRHSLRKLADPIRRKSEGLEGVLRFVAKKSTADDLILVVIDHEDGCPAKEGPWLQQRAEAAVPHRHVAVVFAYREFETWFLHALVSLRGQRGIPADAVPPEDPEARRNAKGLFRTYLNPPLYSPTVDQASFATWMSLSEARNSRSFRKLCKELHMFGDTLAN